MENVFQSDEMIMQFYKNNKLKQKMDFKFFRVVRIIGLVGIKLKLTIQLSCLKQIAKFALKIICHE